MKYTDMFDLAVTTRRLSMPRYKFRDGVERAAALAALEYKSGGEKMIEAVERAFMSMRISINPNWDGSIG